MSDEPTPSVPVPPPAPPGRQPRADAGRNLLRRMTLFPNCYVWYVFFAALDVMLTTLVLHLGGSEVNLLADWILARYELPGLVAFKFSLVVLVVCICETVGRRNHRVGRKLAEWAVAITAIPVVLALVQILVEVRV